MKFANSKLRIIVTGLAGLHPVGGVAWDYLQYVIGLSRLGHDVYYYEDTWSWPYDPIQKKNTDEAGYSANFIHHFFERYAPNLIGNWHYLHLQKESFGMKTEAFHEVARTTDLFINISGASFIPDHLSPKCIKIFLDTDPGYNQIIIHEKPEWSENVVRWCETVKAHNQHFTYAENINEKDCTIPKLPYEWKTTRMPVLLDIWKPVKKDKSMSIPWSTIMTWNAFKGKLKYKGLEYNSKNCEFEKFITLPKRITSPILVAVGGKDIPIARLKENGWRIVDGPSSTISPEEYFKFIRKSKAEFSVAKQVYVEMKTGWFSCRSACYLAAGKPVVVQDTGFSKFIPTGSGLFAFTTMQEIITSMESVEEDYYLHAIMARDIAEEYFDSGKVLNQMLDTIYSS